MKVKIKKLHYDAVIPSYAKPGDAGMDMIAVEGFSTKDHITYRTGLAMEIPENHVGLLLPRSSVYKKSQMLANSVGVIDSGYRGEIMFKFTRSDSQYSVGDRVGQIIILPYPQIEFEEVKELSATNRGTGGFGSTGE
jgi:dUTP pyrophosphatase